MRKSASTSGRTRQSLSSLVCRSPQHPTTLFDAQGKPTAAAAEARRALYGVRGLAAMPQISEVRPGGETATNMRARKKRGGGGHAGSKESAPSIKQEAQVPELLALSLGFFAVLTSPVCVRLGTLLHLRAQFLPTPRSSLSLESSEQER